jgi:hypothetical protein
MFMLDSFSRLIYDCQRRKNWCKKGNEKKVRRDRIKGRVNVMGGLRYSDKKRFVEFFDISNADNFYKLYHFSKTMLHQLLPIEYNPIPRAMRLF